VVIAYRSGLVRAGAVDQPGVRPLQ
jgi:hypothetical protein